MSSTLVGEKSTGKVAVFTVPALTKHPNADSLSTWTIPGTDYSYVGRTEDWQNRVGTTAAWIPPDALVPVHHPEFQFLAADAKYAADSVADKAGGYARIKAKKLRGVVSYGLCVPLTDTPESLGVAHYEPEVASEVYAGFGNKRISFTGGDTAKAPPVYVVKYDVDAFMRYGRQLFQEGEPVYVTEKIHGCNGRYVYHDGAMHCSSRTEFKREFSRPPEIDLDELTNNVLGDREKAKEISDRILNNFTPKESLWWKALKATPALEVYCKTNPGVVVYGEVYGLVQKGFPYDAAGEVKFRAFDIMRDGKWLDAPEFIEECTNYFMPQVPLVGNIPFDFDAIAKMAEGQSLIGDHIREGCVVVPAKERWDDRLGRVKLKAINPEYYNRG